MRSFLFVALLALVAMASAQTRLHLEPEVAASASTSWSLTSLAVGHEMMTVHFMMRHEAADLEFLTAKLMAVSDPRSSQYGQHLTSAEIAKLAPISDEKLAAVREFLEGSLALMQVNAHRDIVKVTLPVHAAESLFKTEIGVFSHTRFNGTTLLRATRPYTVPASVHAAVSVVADLVYLPVISKPVRVLPDTSSVMSSSWDTGCPGLSACGDFVTPAIIHKAYKVDGRGMDNARNTMSIASFQGQYYETSDLKKFSSGCGVDVEVAKTIGGNREEAGIETMLDIEYIRGVSDKIPLTVVYSSDYSLIDWVNKLLSMENPPLVNSVSYGNDEKQQTSADYMNSVNVQFQKAGLQGLTIMFASGDQGVSGREGCGGGWFDRTTRFKPDFPAGSPYVLAVGGTDFLQRSVIGEEKAWSESGGGFSDNFKAPSYQKEAVEQYKKTAKLPEASLWNAAGRGYPDIAALGGQVNSYCVVANGRAEGVAGTSASSPVAASIFARLNGLRLNAGKSPLGFVNPFVYQNPSGFNDVTHGDNKSCSKDFKSTGFEAVKGWDPVTGFGSPNFEALAKLVLA